MIAKFEVRNFKNFDDWFSFDLTDTKQYAFSTKGVVNGIANKALIYGHNGVGKSNLGFAMLDVTLHLNEGSKGSANYRHYLPVGVDTEIAEFKYVFTFGEDQVHYEYGKSDWNSLVYESLTINDALVLKFDRRTDDTAVVSLRGTETLNKKIGDSKISLVTYVKNNSILDDDNQNKLFYRFIKQVEGMFFIRTLNGLKWVGDNFTTYKTLSEYVIERNKLQHLQGFLNKAGINCELGFVKVADETRLAMIKGDKKVLLGDVASTGTISLCLFYFWWQQLEENSDMSFVYIDEFDAFYHHELSRLVVESLSELKAQVILTTHNTSIISNDILRPDCYFLMGENRIESLANRTPKELRSAHNIEKMYRAGAFSG